MKRGTKKYLCDECKAESFHHWIEKNRAARMRCPACGSARLELVTEEAKVEESRAQRVRVQGNRNTTSPDGIPGRGNRRKVT